MKNTALRNALLALGSTMLMGTAACGGNPLVGKWQASPMSMGSSYTITIDLKADGKADVSIGNFNIAGTACTGSLTYTGGEWTSSGMNITYSGTPTCSGAIACTIMGNPFNYDCATAQSMGGMVNPTAGTQMYSLSSDNNTLTLTTTTNTPMGSATSSMQAYTRATGM